MITMLIHRNRILQALAAQARKDTREAVARASDHTVMIRQSQVGLGARALPATTPTSGQEPERRSSPLLQQRLGLSVGLHGARPYSERSSVGRISLG